MAQGSSKELKKATEKYHSALLAYQQLQKQFVNEPNPAKREVLKAHLIAASKASKAAEKEFNHAVASEPVDYEALVDHKVVQEIKLKNIIKESIRKILKESASGYDDPAQEQCMELAKSAGVSVQAAKEVLEGKFRKSNSEHVKFTKFLKANECAQFKVYAETAGIDKGQTEVMMTFLANN